MKKLAPSILSADFSKLGEQIKELENGGADYVHLDVMDGQFVPNISLGPVVIKHLRKITKLKFDVHLMISNPDPYIKEFYEAGADIITVHQETCNHLNRTIQNIKSYGIKAGVALNPATDINTLRYVIEDIDMVLIMSVNPGFGGQKLITNTEKKFRDLKKLLKEVDTKVDIEIDGGVNKNNIKDVVSWGADIVVVGSAIFNYDNIEKETAQFKRLLMEN